jgi:hypothetical protein
MLIGVCQEVNYFKINRNGVFRLFWYCIYIIAQYVLSDALANVYGAIGVERVRVGRVVNLCITRSEMMHITLTCEMRDS